MQFCVFLQIFSRLRAYRCMAVQKITHTNTSSSIPADYLSLYLQSSSAVRLRQLWISWLIDWWIELDVVRSGGRLPGSAYVCYWRTSWWRLCWPHWHITHQAQVLWVSWWRVQHGNGQFRLKLESTASHHRRRHHSLTVALFKRLHASNGVHTYPGKSWKINQMVAAFLTHVDFFSLYIHYHCLLSDTLMQD